MLGKGNKNPPFDKIETIIGPNTNFDGHLTCDGSVRIDGVCEGGMIETVGNVIISPDAMVAADIVAFAGSDLVCYRAQEPAELVVRQSEAWDPVLRWAQDVLGAQFVLAEGVMPVAQPEDALRAFASAIDGYESLKLCALHVMTTLTGSAILSLAHARGAMSAELVWAAAHVDEDFQIAQWGEDDEAAVRREKRLREFQAASLICRALSQDPQHSSINPLTEN